MQDEFKEMETAVIGATVQDLTITEPLAQQLGITYPIITDVDTSIARSYEVYNLPGSMGPFSTHSMFLIDKDGIVRWAEVSRNDMYIQPERVRSQVRRLDGRE